jgi:hypothetical protein
MKTVILALYNQLQVSPDLTYANPSGYHSESVLRLIQLNKFPFYNVIPFPGSDSYRIETVPNMSFKDIERHIYRIQIQYAVRAMAVNEAIMGDITKGVTGVLDFQKDMWDVITADITLGGTVRDILPGYSTGFDMVQDEEDKLFIAGGEMTIEFYKDVFKRS